MKYWDQQFRECSRKYLDKTPKDFQEVLIEKIRKSKSVQTRVWTRDIVLRSSPRQEKKLKKNVPKRPRGCQEDRDYLRSVGGASPCGDRWWSRAIDLREPSLMT